MKTMTIDELTNKLKKQMETSRVADPQAEEEGWTSTHPKSLRRERREKAAKYDEMLLQVALLESAQARAIKRSITIAEAVEAFFHAQRELQDAQTMVGSKTKSTHIAVLGERVRETRRLLGDIVDDTLGGE